MEENLKYKIYGGIFIMTIFSGLIVVNIYIYEPCRKKIEENPDFHENVYTLMPSEGLFIGGITSTASIRTTSRFINDIAIKIN